MVKKKTQKNTERLNLNQHASYLVLVCVSVYAWAYVYMIVVHAIHFATQNSSDDLCISHEYDTLFSPENYTDRCSSQDQ